MPIPSSTSAPRASERPTVCHVVHQLSVGGGEVLAKAIAQRHETEFRPVFALLDGLGELGRELREQGYRIEVLGRKPGIDFRCVLRLRRFFRHEHVRVVHAHQYAPLFYAAMARLPNRRLPILFTEHGRDYPDFRRWRRVLANRALLSSRDRFVAVGDSVRTALVANEGLPANRIEVVYNGRDLSVYDPERSCRRTVRSEIGLAEDEIAIMMVARLNRLKDHPTALSALGHVRRRHANVTLVLVGDGEDRDYLQLLVQQMDLERSVRFLGSRSDVPRLLQGADLFMLSSISEGIPLTLIEAMATGLPVVATAVGGTPEVVVDGETGLLSPAADAARLANASVRLIEDASMRIEMGRRGRDRALKMFDHQTMHEKYRRLYAQLT